MSTRRFSSARITLGITATVALTLCMMLATDAAAQRSRGPRLAPEKAEAAWKLQAEGVAGDLGLKDKKVQQLAAAYVAARKSQQDAMAKLRSEGGGGGGGGGGRGRFQVYIDLNAKEAEKLSSTLEAFLDEEQSTKAMVSLGTFDSSWDRYVNSLVGLELKGSDLTAALKLVHTYSVDVAKVTREARANQDFGGMRSARTELKAKLDGSLEKILSEEQLTTWKAATSTRGSRGGPDRPTRRERDVDQRE